MKNITILKCVKCNFVWTYIGNSRRWSGNGISRELLRDASKKVCPKCGNIFVKEIYEEKNNE